ncbi:MAG: acyltransferase family protein [Candidatus Phocaeicola faecipullorum]|nr:acyltransferase family protein [Candidatus Phocaeicola faecipullorum]
MKGRIATIEFYRFAFMVVLLMWHGPFDSFKFGSGYLVVEFFFILSGYMLMESFYRKPKTAVQYTIDRLKRMYVPYFVALCLACLYFGIIPDLIIRHSVSMELIFPFIDEALLIQGLGLFGGGINYPLWYFSVLIIGGYFLYELISRWQTISLHVIIPILSVLTLTYLSNLQGGTFEIFTVNGVFYVPFWRGMAEMGIGVVLCAFCHSRYNKMHKSVGLDFVAVMTLLLIVCILNSDGNHKYDKYAIIFFPIIIYVGIWNKSFLNKFIDRPVWVKLGGVTYEMYLLHAMTGSLAYRVVGPGIDNIYLFIVYVIAVTLLSFIFKTCCQKLQNKKSTSSL